MLSVWYTEEYYDTGDTGQVGPTSVYSHDVTYPNTLGPKGVQIIKMFG